MLVSVCISLPHCLSTRPSSSALPARRIRLPCDSSSVTQFISNILVDILGKYQSRKIAKFQVSWTPRLVTKPALMN